MGVDISAGDLLTMRKLKNADAAIHLYIDQSDILGMYDTGFLLISNMPIFFNSFWPILIYFIFFGNNTKSLLCRNDKKYDYNFVRFLQERIC